MKKYAQRLSDALVALAIIFTFPMLADYMIRTGAMEMGFWKSYLCGLLWGLLVVQNKRRIVREYKESQ